MSGSGALSPDTLMTIWECGRGATDAGRGRIILRSLGLDETTSGALTVGQRDSAVMDARARAFGSAVSAIADCPVCGARLELEFDLSMLRADASSEPRAAVDVESGGFRIRARPPCVDDLEWLERSDATTDRRAGLLGRCVLEAEHDGRPVDPADLPPDAVAALAAELAAADPQADLRLELECAACGGAWSAGFDIVAFFWDELNTWAWRTAQDVDTLAARYGWTERDILAMSPARRSLYLEIERT